MQFGNRLKKFITTCYENQTVFADKLNVNQATVSRYVNETNQPDLENLIKMQELGLSIDWLIGGIGSMFAENEIGKKLRCEYFNFDCDRDEPLKDQIIGWIKTYYGSIERFALCTHTPLKSVYKILELNETTPPSFLELLEFAGCNLAWLNCLSKNKFSDSFLGNYFSHRYNSIKNGNGNGNGVSNEEYLKYLEEINEQDFMHNKKYSPTELINSIAVLHKLLQQ